MFCMVSSCFLSLGPSLRQDPEKACRVRRARWRLAAGNPQRAGVERAGRNAANTARTDAGLRD